MSAPMKSVNFTKMFLRKIARLSNPIASQLMGGCKRSMCSAENEVRFLPRGDNVIAYTVLSGKKAPGILFCSGFQSNMMGVKANAILEYCKQNDLGFVRFDYQGVGQSTGDVKNATLSEWKKDVLAVLDNLTAGPQIIVGSSIGGLLMLEAAVARPNRVHSLLGIATAADVSERGVSNYPQEVRERVETEGVAEWTRDHNTYIITQTYVDDLKNHKLLGSEIPVNAPVRLLHGMEDETVPYRVSLQVAESVWSNDVNVTLCKLADHRFSQPEDIQLIFEMLDYLIHGADKARELAITSWSAFTVYNKQKKVTKVVH